MKLGGRSASLELAPDHNCDRKVLHGAYQKTAIKKKEQNVDAANY